MIVSIFTRHTGAVCYVGIATAIDNYFCQNSLATSFAFYNNTFQFVAFHYHTGAKCSRTILLRCFPPTFQALLFLHSRVLPALSSYAGDRDDVHSPPDAPSGDRSIFVVTLFMIWLPFCPRKPRMGKPMVMLPPTKLRLSINNTRSPSSAAAIAAVMPDGPPPTTSTSTCALTGISFEGSLMLPKLVLHIIYSLSFLVFCRSSVWPAYGPLPQPPPLVGEKLSI